MQRIKQGNKRNITLKRKLRLEMTPAEKKLWLQLRAKQLSGFKFRRQHGIGPYIVDFYCPQKNLVIEVDGDIHAQKEQIARDKEKESYLKELGLQIIRYQNDDVLTNLKGVMEDLFKQVNIPTLPPFTPPYKGGEKSRNSVRS
jgi:very-short-patch-repair endonuclease